MLGRDRELRSKAPNQVIVAQLDQMLEELQTNGM